jgi:hypothetical protein
MSERRCSRVEGSLRLGATLSSRRALLRYRIWDSSLQVVSDSWALFHGPEDFVRTVFGALGRFARNLAYVAREPKRRPRRSG